MKASIVIPNLNGAGWLRDSIESIWAQTEQDFELIIIDNGSTDESLAIARSYVGRPGYTLVENQTNTGFSAAVNTGIGLGKRRICGAVQQRCLCTAGLAGTAHCHGGCRAARFCGAKPDDPAF